MIVENKSNSPSGNPVARGDGIISSMETTVKGLLVNDRWSVPSSSQSPSWTAARITTIDEKVYEISVMGIPGGSHTQVERRTLLGDRARMEMTIPFPGTPPSLVAPSIFFRGSDPDAAAFVEELSGLNGNVKRVENMVSSKPDVFDAERGEQSRARRTKDWRQELLERWEINTEASRLGISPDEVVRRRSVNNSEGEVLVIGMADYPYSPLKVIKVEAVKNKEPIFGGLYRFIKDAIVKRRKSKSIVSEKLVAVEA